MIYHINDKSSMMICVDHKSSIFGSGTYLDDVLVLRAMYEALSQ